ncbi:MAG: DUF1987 domain-containing protein [Microscillaceae bacterium]|nr:DUF1987 domain-containing protein [Microscillaceae bacterium]
MSTENFYIEKSNYIPSVDFNAETGILNISGKSYHEYTLEFFEPIFDWLKRYTAEGGKKVELNFRMSYFNTSPSRRFLEIMNLLETYQLNKNKQVTINWFYDDDDDNFFAPLLT